MRREQFRFQSMSLPGKCRNSPFVAKMAIQLLAMVEEECRKVGLLMDLEDERASNLQFVG